MFGADIDELMITFTKNTMLIEYQIIRLREAFIKARITPNNNETIEKLKDIFPDWLGE